MIYNYPIINYKIAKSNFFSVFIALIFLCAINNILNAQNYWMQRGGGSTADEAYSIACDGSNNSYTTGYFTGTATFGNTTLTANGISDIFVAKINSFGVYQWAVKGGDGGSDRGLAIACDGSGNSYVTGYYYGTATFGVNSVTSVGLQNAFIVKYDASGNVKWVVSCGGSQSTIGNSIAFDNNGNVIVTGQFSGTANFGANTLTSNSNNINVFTTKINASTGAFVWAVAGTGKHTDRGLGVACDGSGNVYVTGQYSDTITFSTPYYSPLNNAIFLIKYNSSGIEQWANSAGGGTSNIANAIAVDNSSNAYITGNFTGTLNFYANIHTTLTQTYSNRIFIAKYDQSGNLLWEVADGSSNSITSNGIAVDGSGNPYITGDFECTLNSYADRYGQGTFNSVGDWDIFNAEYSSSSGAWQWSRQIGGHGNNYANGIAVSSGGNIFDAGSFDQDMIITDNPNNFKGYGTSSVGCASTYCSDPNYGDYAVFYTNGDLDAFIAEPIDLSRQTYDFYLRTGNSCSRPVVPACIGTGNTCQKTAEFCTSGSINVIPNVCADIAPNFNWSWSNGGNGVSTVVISSGQYSVTQTSVDGCISTGDTINVTINPPPPPPTISDNVVINTNSIAPQPIRVCEHPVTLTAGNYVGNTSWYWSLPDKSVVNNSSLTINFGSDSGNYCFAVIDKNGCTNQTCVFVAIDSALPLIAPKLICTTCTHDSAVVCSGSSFEMLPYDTISNPTANPNKCIPDVINYWAVSPDSTVGYLYQTSCLDINVISVRDSGWYHISDTVVESNACGKKKYILTDSIFLRVHPLPVVTLNVTGKGALCAGDSEWLVGSGNVPFMWSNGSTEDSIYVGIGSYSIKASVTNQYGCTTNSVASYGIPTFNPPIPEIAMDPPNGVICPGDSVKLTCTLSPFQQYQWFGPKGPLGINDSVAYAKIPGNYYCVGSDSVPCPTSRLSNTVLVESYATPYLQLPTKSNICPGDSIELVVIASNSAIVQWQPPLSGDSLVQYVKTPGKYSVKIISCGITTLCSTNITESSPVATIKVTPSKTICTAGDSIQLSGLPYMSNYLWKPTNDTTRFIYIKQAGTYSLSTIDTFGCTASADINIYPPIRDSISNLTNINCTGESTGLISIGVKGGLLPYTYSWSPSVSTTAKASGLSAGTYTVSITDGNGCLKSIPVALTQPAIHLASAISSFTSLQCFDDFSGSITESPTGGVQPYTYLWDPGGQTSSTLKGLSAGTYTINLTDANGCSASSSITLTQPPLLKVAISESRVICQDSTGTLTATANGGTPPYKYNWNSGSSSSTATITPVASNDYSITITDAKGCTATAQILLQYGPPVKLNVTGNTHICTGDSTTLCASATGAIYGATYWWEPANSTDACITVGPINTTIYTITVRDGCGATVTATPTVYARPTPVANMSANLFQGCAPFCVQFYNATNILQSSVLEYIWQFGNGDTSHAPSPIYCYQTGGMYSVSLTVITDSGCSSTMKKINMITIYNPPSAAFTYSPEPATILTPTIQFTDQSTDPYGGMAYWWWKFGDATDSTSNAQNPIHTYQDTGTFCANLVVMDNNGCTDTVTNCLVIDPVFSLYIPSAFTPNGDGLNETFKPIGQYIRNYELYIFDRWGMELFHSTNINEGWNGSVHGSSAICQEDVYIYKIMVTDSRGQQHSYVGNVTLLK